MECSGHQNKHQILQLLISVLPLGLDEIRGFFVGEDFLPGVKGAAKAPLQGGGTVSPWGFRGAKPPRKIVYFYILTAKI